MFKNRKEAGKILARSLEKTGTKADTVVASTRSGLKVAEKVSKELGLPHTAVMSKKLKAGEKGPVFGAVAQEGTIWLEDRVIEEFTIDRGKVQRMAEKARRKLAGQVKALDGVERRDLKGENILLVTDGISSGARTSASLGACMKKGIDHSTVATPFMSRHVQEKLSDLADEVHEIRKPRFVASVEDGYVSKQNQRTVT